MNRQTSESRGIGLQCLYFAGSLVVAFLICWLVDHSAWQARNTPSVPKSSMSADGNFRASGEDVISAMTTGGNEFNGSPTDLSALPIGKILRILEAERTTSSLRDAWTKLLQILVKDDPGKAVELVLACGKPQLQTLLVDQLVAANGAEGLRFAVEAGLPAGSMMAAIARSSDEDFANCVGIIKRAKGGVGPDDILALAKLRRSWSDVTGPVLRELTKSAEWSPSRKSVLCKWVAAFNLPLAMQIAGDSPDPIVARQNKREITSMLSGNHDVFAEALNQTVSESERTDLIRESVVAQFLRGKSISPRSLAWAVKLGNPADRMTAIQAIAEVVGGGDWTRPFTMAKSMEDPEERDRAMKAVEQWLEQKKESDPKRYRETRMKLEGNDGD